MGSARHKHGRYAFGNQRAILRWNLERFAEALEPLCSDATVSFDEIEAKLEAFEEVFEAEYYAMMRRKLGIPTDGAEQIVDELVDWLRTSSADYTNTFIELETPSSFNDPIYASAEFERLREQVAQVGFDEELMQQANPRYIPRNYLVENALTQYVEEKDLSRFRALLDVLENPFESDETKSLFQEPPPREYDAEYTTYCNT